MGALRLTPAEQQLLETANKQFGLLRYGDLVAAGLTRNAIRARREACRLTRVHDGVYAFGHTALRDEGRWLASLWSAGDDVSLSHVTAAAFHGWEGVDRAGGVHLSTTRAIQSRDGITVHRVSSLTRPDIHRSRLFSVTNVPRTLVDLADVMDWPDYRALADRLPYLRVDKIREAQSRAPNRSGRGRVTRLIEADDAHTKSEFERRFLRFVGAQRLPRPDALNEWVAGQKADCVYRTGSRKLVVELDGRAHHARRAQMRVDRHRDTEYQVAGYLVLRLVWDDLHAEEAERTARRLRRLLDLPA